MPKDLPTARIMTFGYDADIIGALRVAGSNTLRDHGKTLAHELATSRRRSVSVSISKQIEWLVSNSDTRTVALLYSLPIASEVS